MNAPMTLDIVTPYHVLSDRIIESNIAELLPQVKARTAEYRTTEYTISQEKMCKEHRATINKFLSAVTDEMKKVQKANNAPYKAFEEEMEPLVKELLETIEILDGQLKEMENVWRSNNLESTKVLYKAIVEDSGFGSWLPLAKIMIAKKTGRTSYEDFFGNKGSWSYPEGQEECKDLEVLMKAGRKVAEVFEQLVNRARTNLATINELDFTEEIKQQGIGYLQDSFDPVKKEFDIDGAMRMMADINRREREKREAVERAQREAEKAAAVAAAKAEEEKKRAIEEAKRQAELEKQKAVEEARAEALQKKQEPQKQEPVAPKPNEKIYHLKFESSMTMSQAKQLRTFCDSIGIELKMIQ